MLSGQVFPSSHSLVQKIEEAHRLLNPKETLFRIKGMVKIRHTASKYTQGPLLLLGLSQDVFRRRSWLLKGFRWIVLCFD